MAAVHGLRSFEGVRDRATRVEFDGAPLLVATLSDIIRSTRTAGRPQDLAVLPLREQARETSEPPGSEARRRPKRK